MTFAPDAPDRVRQLPGEVRVVVIGAGFAGAATAAALASAGAGPGLLLEREALPGMHASGRNAAIARQVEFDATIRELALDGVRRLRALRGPDAAPLVDRRGGLYLASPSRMDAFDRLSAALAAEGVDAHVWTPLAARNRFPFLSDIAFGAAIFCPSDGTIQIHDVLSSLLTTAREGRFPLVVRCGVEDLLIEAGRVTGVVTGAGVVRAEAVVDATGAWAGRLGRPSPLPLRPMRRHLFVSGETRAIPRDAPIVWDVDASYYFRPEGAGLLLSPCDESSHEPAPPGVDPAAVELLAGKLAQRAPALADLGIRTGWACLRTFAPDRNPVIGADPGRPGLFHVSGLGGFGATTALAVGALAASLVTTGDTHPLDPRRLR